MPAISPLSLSDDEFEALAEGLDRFSDLDADGVLGLFHAVAVAPAMVLPSAWLPVVGPDGFGGRDSRQVDEFVGLVMRQYNEVIDALEHGQVICPDPEDAAACESFAAGFVAGAELVPEWIGDADRWTFATPFAYLAGRLDLVPKAELAKIEHELGPDPKQITRREMAACIAAANTSFEEHRLATAQPSHAPAPRTSRVGRNEPCPCGSGKKYKRCCAA